VKHIVQTRLADISREGGPSFYNGRSAKQGE
jgi:hypothetical protein